MSKLPAAAQARLAALEQARLDAFGLQATAAQSVSDVRQALFTARAAGDAAAIRSGEAALATAETLLGQRQSWHRNIAACMANVRRFLDQLPADVVIDPAPYPAPKMQRGERLTDGLKRVEADITRLRAELRQVRAAPRTRAELERQAAEHVQELAKRAVPRVSIDHAGDLVVAWHPDQSFANAGSASRNYIQLMAAMFPNELLGFLRGEIDLLDDSKAIPAGDRIEQIAKLEHDLFAAEVMHCSFVAAACAAGFDARYLPTVDVRALLGIRAPIRAARAA